MILFSFQCTKVVVRHSTQLLWSQISAFVSCTKREIHFIANKLSANIIELRNSPVAPNLSTMVYIVLVSTISSLSLFLNNSVFLK